MSSNCANASGCRIKSNFPCSFYGSASGRTWRSDSKDKFGTDQAGVWSDTIFSPTENCLPSLFRSALLCILRWFVAGKQRQILAAINTSGQRRRLNYRAGKCLWKRAANSATFVGDAAFGSGLFLLWHGAFQRFCPCAFKNMAGSVGFLHWSSASSW